MKILAYIIYLLVMSGMTIVLVSANVGANTWQFWAIIFGFATVFACGCAYGERI